MQHYHRQNTQNSNVLIFKTNIKTKKKAMTLNTIFTCYSDIIKWSVDTEDVDKVLRIVSTGRIEEYDIIHILKNSGLYCEVLAG